MSEANRARGNESKTERNEIGPAGFEPATKGLCLPPTVFTASFEFVVWTIPSLYVSAVWSLHLPPKLN